jgi:hypothetical protein
MRRKNRVAARCRRCSEVSIFGVKLSFACFSICMHGMYFAKAALFSRAFWVPNLGRLVWVSLFQDRFVILLQITMTVEKLSFLIACGTKP